jgi:Uma2 family endonuclease
MATAQLKEKSEAGALRDGGYTYADLKSWEGPERYELHDGTAVFMESPSENHQIVQMNVSGLFWVYLKGKTCRVMGAPLDVRLFPEDDESDTTVFQPDVLVVCDEKKRGSKSINGAPTLVVEIVSPSSIHYDGFYKLRKYQDAGVKEYWTINPEQRIVNVYHFATKKEGDKGWFDTYSDGESITVESFPGLTIALQDIFDKTTPASE